MEPEDPAYEELPEKPDVWPRPPPTLLIQAGAASVATLASYLALVDYAAMRDGPGIGFGDPLPLGWIWVGATLAFFVSWREVRRSVVIVLACFVLLAALGVSQTGQRLLALTWGAQCEAGDRHACYGAAGLYWRGLGVAEDRERATELDARACLGEIDPGANEARRWGCARLLDERVEPLRERVCATLRTECDEASGPFASSAFACEQVAEHCEGRPITTASRP